MDKITRYKIKGRTYKVIEDIPIVDEIVSFKKLVQDSKGNQFYLIHSIIGYFLYTLDNKRVLATYSVQEI